MSEHLHILVAVFPGVVLPCMTQGQVPLWPVSIVSSPDPSVQRLPILNPETYNMILEDEAGPAQAKKKIMMEKKTQISLLSSKTEDGVRRTVMH